MVAVSSAVVSPVLPRGGRPLAAPRAPGSRVLEYTTDALLVLALALLAPLTILLVGAPLALAVRALLWAIERF